MYTLESKVNSNFLKYQSRLALTPANRLSNKLPNNISETHLVAASKIQEYPLEYELFWGRGGEPERGARREGEIPRDLAPREGEITRDLAPGGQIKRRREISGTPDRMPASESKVTRNATFLFCKIHHCTTL